jgi:hypothetical protein
MTTTTAPDLLDQPLAHITVRRGFALTRSGDGPVDVTIGDADTVHVPTAPGRLGWENFQYDWHHAVERMGLEVAVESFDVGDTAQVMTGTIEVPLCENHAALGVRVRYGDRCLMCGLLSEPAPIEDGAF